MKRIFGITWTNCNGQKVAMYERDFESHEAFMAERRSLKAKGIKLNDLTTAKAADKKPVKKIVAKSKTTKSKTSQKKTTAKPKAKKASSTKKVTGKKSNPSTKRKK